MLGTLTFQEAARRPEYTEELIKNIDCIVRLCLPAQHSENSETAELAKDILAIIDCGISVKEKNHV